MNLSKLDRNQQLMLVGGAAFVLWLLYRNLPQVAGAAAQKAAEAAANAAGGIVTGAVTGISQQFGLPTPSDTTDDPYVVRWLIDDPRGGEWEASKWASAAAFARAQFLPSGSGRPPPQGTKLAMAFPPYINTGGASGSW